MTQTSPGPPSSPGADQVARLLGLGVRARGVTVGVEGARAALQRGRVECVVLARDASPRARARIERLAQATGVPLVRGPAAEQLGAGLGRPAVHAVAVHQRSLADGMLGRRKK